MSENGHQVPPSPLGAHFNATPFTWAWKDGQAQTPNGPARAHVLVLETIIGRLAFVLTEDDLRNFVRSAQARTGIVIPEAVLPPGLIGKEFS